MNKKMLNYFSVLYLGTPLLVFSIGYLRWYITVAVLTLFSLASCRVLQSLRRECACSEISISPQNILIVAIASFAISFLLGVGGYYTQSTDWMAKNPVLNDLVDSAWPVIIYPKCMSAEIQALIGSDSLALVYYFFFYMPAACIGKLFGIGAAHFALYFWTAIGLFLVICSLVLFSLPKICSKRYACLIVLFFIFFGGGDFVGHILRLIVLKVQGVSPLYATWRIDEWCRPYFSYYGANWTSLYWCFNQCIPVWLITSLILLNNDLKSVGFWYSFTLLYSPWAAMGLFPVIFIYVAYRLFKDIKLMLSVLTLQNIVFSLFVLLVVGSFYMSNRHPLADCGWWWKFELPMVFLPKYIAFILLELGIYFYAMRNELCKSSWLIISFVVLLFIPFYKMTVWNDFMMRASLPALFIVFMYWTRWCMRNLHSRRMLIVVVSVVTSLTALQLMVNSLVDTICAGKPVLTNANEHFCNTSDLEVIKLGEGQFFAHDYKTTFFWKYLSR